MVSDKFFFYSILCCAFELAYEMPARKRAKIKAMTFAVLSFNNEGLIAQHHLLP